MYDQAEAAPAAPPRRDHSPPGGALRIAGAPAGSDRPRVQGRCHRIQHGRAGAGRHALGPAGGRGRGQADPASAAPSHQKISGRAPRISRCPSQPGCGGGSGGGGGDGGAGMGANPSRADNVCPRPRACGCRGAVRARLAAKPGGGADSQLGRAPDVVPRPGGVHQHGRGGSAGRPVSALRSDVAGGQVDGGHASREQDGEDLRRGGQGAPRHVRAANLAKHAHPL